MMTKRSWIAGNDIENNRELFDMCVKTVDGGFAEAAKEDYPPCIEMDGKRVLSTAVLEYFITNLEKAGFEYEKAYKFSENLRRLAGWEGISYSLEQWVEKRFCEPYFKRSTNEINELGIEARGQIAPDRLICLLCDGIYP